MDEDKEHKICNVVKTRIDVKNVLAVYFFAHVFKLPSVSKLSLRLIERCFSIVSGSPNFSHLDARCVAEILSSDELDIDSEMEIAQIAESWLLHDDARRNHARLLLSKVRIPQLSSHFAVLQVFNKPCFNVSFYEVGKYLYGGEKARYCSQNSYDVIFGGGNPSRGKFASFSNVYRVDVNTLNALRFSKLKRARSKSKMFCGKGQLYVFGGVRAVEGGDEPVMSVEKFSPRDNAWQKVAEMYDGRERFCATCFMGDVYVMGGIYRSIYDLPQHTEDSLLRTESCVKFSFESGRWAEKAPMNFPRFDAAAAVYLGTVVVCGGWGRAFCHKSAEYYDHVTDSWFRMGDLVLRRHKHKLVASGRKLFACGGRSRTFSVEMYDQSCSKFFLIRMPLQLSRFCVRHLAEAVIVGRKLFIFGINSRDMALVLDIEKDGWRVETVKYEFRKGLTGYSCVKVPHFKQTAAKNYFLTI